MRKKDAKWAISVASAALASIVACLSSQPGDMILTATYKGSKQQQQQHSGAASVPPRRGVAGTGEGIVQAPNAEDKRFGTVVRGIYSAHGLRGFYLGTQARIAHVGAIITSQLVIYDLVKIALGLPATGSH